MEESSEDVVFDICGASRDSPIVCENVPGSVAKRYRGIKFVSGSALVRHFDSNWFVTFSKDARRNEVVLTITNGSEVPPQDKVAMSSESNSRGTLIVTQATSTVLTGNYVISFLQSSSNAHDVYVTSRGFELHRLVPDLANLKTRRPELFRKSTERYRSRARQMKRTALKSPH